MFFVIAIVRRTNGTEAKRIKDFLSEDAARAWLKRIGCTKFHIYEGDEVATIFRA